MSEKRVIKASEIEATGISVEKVDYEIRKFGNKVYKHVPLDEPPVEMEDQAGLAESEPADQNQVGDEQQVQLERFYGDQGELTGLKITCRCGEVIDLEFVREQDELPSEAEQQAASPQEQPGQAAPPVLPDSPESEKPNSQ